MSTQQRQQPTLTPLHKFRGEMPGLLKRVRSGTTTAKDADTVKRLFDTYATARGEGVLP